MAIFNTRYSDKSHYLVYTEGKIEDFTKFYIIHESDEHYFINYGARGAVGKFLPVQDGDFACRLDGVYHKKTAKEAQQKLDKKQKEGYQLVSEGDFYAMHIKAQFGAVALIYVHGYFGLIDEQKRVVVPPIYADLSACGDTGLWIAKRKDSHYGIIDNSHRIVAPFVHKSLTFDAAAGRFLSKIAGGAFYLDTNGQFVGEALQKAPEIAPKSARIAIEHDKKTKKQGLKSLDTGEWLARPKYDLIAPFSAGYAVCRFGEFYGLMDMTGAEVLTTSYEFLQEASDGLVPFRKDRLWGFLDMQGREIIAPKYGWVGGFIGDLAPFGDNLQPPRKYGYINRSGEVVIEPIYDAAGRFGDGLAPVKQGDLLGYIDAAGKVVIDFQYIVAEAFSAGLAVVVGPDFMMGCIDISGKIVIPCIYESVWSILNGLFAVRKGYKWGVLDRKGQPLTEFIYDDIRPNGIAQGVPSFKLKNKWVELPLPALP